MQSGVSMSSRVIISPHDPGAPPLITHDNFLSGNDSAVTIDHTVSSIKPSTDCDGSHQAFLQIIAEIIFVVVLSFAAQYSKNVEKVAMGLLITMFTLYFIMNGGATASRVANIYQSMLGQKQTN